MNSERRAGWAPLTMKTGPDRAPVGAVMSRIVAPPIAHGVTLSVALLVTPFPAADMVMFTADVTVVVVMGKVAVVDPGATVTLAGTVAVVELEASVTMKPVPTAAKFRVTVPVEPLPPTTVAGLKLTPEGESTRSERVAFRVVLPSVAEIVTLVVAVTVVVVIGNVAVRAPPATVTLAGTVAAALFEASVMVSPPAGAGPFSVTVPVEVPPPAMVAGLRVRDEVLIRLTVRLALRVVPPSEAEMATVVLVVTGTVVTVNVAVVAPAATVTLAGTVATAVLFDASVTTAPPAGAAAASVTVPVEFALPPTRLVGLSVSPEGVSGVTVRVAVRVVPPALAVTETAVLAATAEVVTVNVAVVAPAATVTLAGTVATVVLFDASVTTAPPAGAAAASVTVPVEFTVPPTTLVGLSVSPEGVSGVTVRVAVRVVPPALAVTETAVLAATAEVVTVNVAVVAPAATVTLGGTAATPVLFDASVTTAPPAGAAEASVTVPVEFTLPPTTLVGLSVSPEGTSGATVRFADTVVPPAVAVIATVVLVVTAEVATVKVAVVAPAGTVTLPGTVAAAVLLDASDIDTPPAGATAPSVTVPIEVALPPMTLVGFSVSPEGASGATVRLAVRVTAPALAVIVTVVPEATGTVVTGKVALVAPPTTVTLAGTAAVEGSLLLSDTTVPAAGARPSSVTVPVELPPPMTAVGLSARAERDRMVTVRVAVADVP
jgi:hypothetical protein